MALYDLIVNIAADTADLVQGMKTAEASVTSFANAVKGAVEVLGIAEIARFTEEVIAAGTAMNTAIQRSGASAQAFQQLAYAANTVGVSTETLSTAMTRMERNLSSASSGIKAPSEALTALGLSFQQLKALSPDQQFLLIGQRIAALQSPLDQARAAQALFSRSFQELIPLFKTTQDEMDRLRNEAPILSGDQLKALDDAHKSIVGMNKAFDYMVEVLLSKVAPAIAAFSKSLGDLAKGDTKGAGGSWQDFLSNITAGFIPSTATTNSLRSGVIQRPPVLPDAPPGYGKPPPDLRVFTGGGSHLSAAGNFPNGPFAPGPALSEDLTSTLDTEQKANAQLFDTQLKLDDLLKNQVISQEEYNTRLEEAKATHDAIYDRVQQIDVTLAHLKLPLSDAHVLAQSLADDFANAAGSALHAGSSIAQNFLRALITNLENSAIQTVVRNLATEMLGIFSDVFSGTDSSSSNQGGLLGAFFQGLINTFVPGAALGGLGNFSPSYGGDPYDLSSTGLTNIPSISPDISSVGAGAGGGGRGSSIVMHYNIDARGADADRIMTIMPALLNQATEKAKNDILTAFNRNGIPAPRSA